MSGAVGSAIQGSGIRVGAPGNLLLCGEYAVLEPGGLGIALAVAPRAVAEIAPQAGRTSPRAAQRSRRKTGLQITCRTAPGRPPVVYRPRAQLEEATRLPATCFSYLEREGLVSQPRNLEITLDTRSFFAPNGEKRGFGSSAAATVACSAALLTAEGYARARVRELLLEHAVAIHREFQGGRGSGYDVLISTLGGAALFRGGPAPQAEPITAPWLHGAFIAFASESVATSGAVHRYERWKLARPEAARNFIERSNALVTELAGAQSRGHALTVIGHLAELGVELGRQIEVPAEPPSEVRGRVAARLGPTVAKALGAGNELVLCLPSGEPPPRLAERDRDTIQPLQPAFEGVSWSTASEHNPSFGGSTG